MRRELGSNRNPHITSVAEGQVSMRYYLIGLAFLSGVTIFAPERIARAASDNQPDLNNSTVYVSHATAPTGNWIEVHVSLRNKSRLALAGRSVVLRLSQGSGAGISVKSLGTAGNLQFDTLASSTQATSAVVTDATGTAYFSVQSSVAGNVTLIADDTTDSVVLSNRPVQLTFTVAPTPPPADDQPDLNNSTVYVDHTTASIGNWISVQVFLRNKYGLALGGKSVALQLSQGSGTGISVKSLGTGGNIQLDTFTSSAQATSAVVTDSSGTAYFWVKSTVAGNVTLIPDDTTDSVSLSNWPLQLTFTSPPTTPSPAPTAKVVVAPKSVACAAHRMEEVVAETIGRFFCFAGLNLRIDSVQAVAKADSSPLLTKNLNTQPDPDLGYVVVKVTMQNLSNSRSQYYPGNWLGFDLADGSKIELAPVNAEYVGPNLSDPPDKLSPGETLQITYVVVNWNRSPIRTMYLKRNTGNEENDPGVQYARFSLAPAI